MKINGDSLTEPPSQLPYNHLSDLFVDLFLSTTKHQPRSLRFRDEYINVKQNPKPHNILIYNATNTILDKQCLHVHMIKYSY